MIPVHTRDQTHWLHPDAVARISEAGASSQWHGIRCFVRLFDGTLLESTDTHEVLLGLIDRAHATLPR